MTPDSELLRRYAERADEAAFTEFLGRHVDWVYSAALRLVVGDAHLAEDITQSVFTDLARQAGKLSRHAALAAWLHTSTRYAASKLIDREQRRRAREQEAVIMHDQNQTAEISWEHLRPTLDEAVGQLDEADRSAIVLRFFQGQSHRDIGAHFGLNENTARMRVERALEKLRSYFARRGLKTSVALLATTIAANAVQAAPAGLAAKMAGVSAANAASAGAPSGGFSVFRMLSATKTQAWLAGAVVVAILAWMYFGVFADHPSSPGDKTATSNSGADASASFPSRPANAPSLSTTRGTIAATLSAADPTVTVQNTTASDASPPPIVAPAVIPAAATPAPAGPRAEALYLPALVAANNQFAVDLFRRFNPAPTENAFFSPYSISTVLAAVWAGARGQTEEQIARVLHFNEVAQAEVTPGFGALQQKLMQNQVETGTEFDIANSFWPEQDPEHPFSTSYVIRIQNDFATAVFPVDFKNQAEAASRDINAWVEEKTRGKIRDIVRAGEVDKNTRLVIVNTIYFKAKWRAMFQFESTLESEFHLANGTTKPVWLMHDDKYIVHYAELPDAPVPCQIISLLYYDRLAISSRARNSGTPIPGTRGGPPTNSNLEFVVVLPRGHSQLPELEKALTADLLAGWMKVLDASSERPINVFLPRFSFAGRYPLGEQLQAMGMTDAFNLKADFSGMNGIRNLFITTLVHQTFIDVDELGTEAVGVTRGGAAWGASLEPPVLPLFRADHPFLFLIRDKSTGSILFLGRFASPP